MAKSLNAPYYLLRGGYLVDSSLYDAVSTGYYRSSTPDGPNYAYTFYFYSGSVLADLSITRVFGFSVRCVAAG